MKKIVLLFITALALQTTSAQIYSNTFSSPGNNVVNLTNFRQGGQFVVNSLGIPSNVEGSVYFEDGYHLATVSMIDSEQPAVGAYVTYDVYNNMMMMSEDVSGKDAFVLSQARNILITFKNHTFKFIDYKLNGEELSNYVQILSNPDENNLLVIVRTKSIFEDTTPVSSYSTPKPPRLKMNTQYLIIDKNGEATQIENNKKGFYKNLESQNQEMMKDFIKQNKVKFDEDLKGLIETANYYFSLKK